MLDDIKISDCTIRKSPIEAENDKIKADSVHGRCPMRVC